MVSIRVPEGGSCRSLHKLCRIRCVVFTALEVGRHTARPSLLRSLLLVCSWPASLHVLTWLLYVTIWRGLWSPFLYFSGQQLGRIRTTPSHPLLTCINSLKSQCGSTCKCVTWGRDGAHSPGLYTRMDDNTQSSRVFFMAKKILEEVYRNGNTTPGSVDNEPKIMEKIALKELWLARVSSALEDLQQSWLWAWCLRHLLSTWEG